MNLLKNVMCIITWEKSKKISTFIIAGFLTKAPTKGTFLHIFTLLPFVTFIFLSLRDVLSAFGGYGNKAVVVSFVSVF